MGNTKKKKGSTESKKKNPLLTMGLIAGVIILVFVLLLVLQNLQHSKALKDYNPYGKDNLNAPTKDLLKDKNYQNIILPEDLQARIDSGKPTTAYFFSPTCEYCKQTTPIVAPLSKDLGVDLVQYNLLEFNQGWQDYNIEATPTIVHFDGGKEVGRVVGYQTKPSFEKFFNSITK